MCKELLTAFAGGLLSFTSPCILPLIPAYLSYTTGYSVQDLRHGDIEIKRSLTRALAFVAGFSIIFTLLGTATGTVGTLLIKYRSTLARVSGIVLVILALQVSHLINLNILNKTKKLNLIRQTKSGLIQSFLVGIVFAVGWTPCVGPILSSILLLAATTSTTKGTVMLFVYSLGIGLPFILFSMFTEAVFRFVGSINFRLIELLSALLLFLAGAYLIVNGSF